MATLFPPALQSSRNGNVSLAGNNVVNLFSASPNFRPAYTLSYNLNIQKSLGKKVILQIGYVGSEARRLLILRDINQAALGSGFVTTVAAAGFSYQQTTRPYFSQYPNFGVIDEIQSTGTSNYNGLQTSLRTSSWHGLISQVNFTWSHSLDEVTQYVGALPEDSTNLKGNYGNSDFDIPLSFTAYVIYDIPGLHLAQVAHARLAGKRKLVLPQWPAVQRSRVFRHQRDRGKHHPRR